MTISVDAHEHFGDGFLIDRRCKGQSDEIVIRQIAKMVDCIFDGGFLLIGNLPNFLELGEERLAKRASLEVRPRSEENTSELQSLMRISYAVFCLTKKIYNTTV